MIDLILLGGGEHATVVADAIHSWPSRYRLLGFVDPKPPPGAEQRLGAPCLGDDEQALEAGVRAGARFVLGVGAVGSVGRRVQVVERYTSRGAIFEPLVHQRAWVSPSAVVGPGAVVMAMAAVNAGAQLGAYSLVNTGAVIEHDVQLGAHAQVGPGAVVGGGAQMGERSYLGLGCRVRDHLRVGAHAVVGMGAVVVKSVEDGAVVVGTPARGR